MDNDQCMLPSGSEKAPNMYTVTYSVHSANAAKVFFG